MANTQWGEKLTKQNGQGVFDRSGLAALSDLQTEACQDIFTILEQQQSEFLVKAGEFRSEEYKWPIDPLHCWSRVWEYPYVYYHLNRYMKGLATGSSPVVADVGSGVTFFPFALAQLGCEVVCTDIDPVCDRDIARARKCVTHLPGSVNFRLINKQELPFADDECDVVYCISVLEHIPDFENTLREMARVLKPGGLCLLTCDLDIDPVGNTQLNCDQYRRLITEIEQYFSLLHPDQTIHPVDVLTSRNSIYSVRQKTFFNIGWDFIKQKILKPLLGRKPGNVSFSAPPHLAILALVLQKNARH